MLTKDPAARATLEDVMRHPWVTARGTDPLPLTIYASVVRALLEPAVAPLAAMSAQEEAVSASGGGSLASLQSVVESGLPQPATGAAADAAVAAVGTAVGSLPLPVPATAGTLQSMRSLLQRHGSFSKLECSPTPLVLGTDVAAQPLQLPTPPSNQGAPLTAPPSSPVHPVPTASPPRGLSAAAHSASAARILLAGDADDAGGAMPADPTQREEKEEAGGAVGRPRAATAAAPGATNPAPAGLGARASDSSRGQAQARELEALLELVRRLGSQPLVPPGTVFSAPARPPPPPSPDDGYDAEASPPLSPQPASSTPRIWWRSRPGADTSAAAAADCGCDGWAAADQGGVTTSEGASSCFLRPGGSSPSAATDEFPALSLRVFDSLLLQGAARAALTRGEAAAATAALWDNWMRPPDDDGPELNMPPERPCTEGGWGTAAERAAAAQVWDRCMLRPGDSLWGPPLGTGGCWEATGEDGGDDGDDDDGGIVEEIDAPESLEAELGTQHQQRQQEGRPLTDPELAQLDDVVAYASTAAAAAGGRGGAASDPAHLAMHAAREDPSRGATLAGGAVSAAVREISDASRGSGSRSRPPSGDAASPNELQQLFTTLECSSRPLHIAFGVAEARGVPDLMEDRTVAVLGMEALAAGESAGGPPPLSLAAAGASPSAAHPAPTLSLLQTCTAKRPPPALLLLPDRCRARAATRPQSPAQAYATRVAAALPLTPRSRRSSWRSTTATAARAVCRLWRGSSTSTSRASRPSSPTRSLPSRRHLQRQVRAGKLAYHDPGHP